MNPTVKIKALAPADVDNAVTLLKACWDEMDFGRRGESFNPVTVRARLQQASAQNVFYAWGAWQNNQLVGLVAVALVASLTDVSHVKAVEIVWHSHPKLSPATRAKIQLRLLGVMQKAAVHLGARTLHVSVPPECPSARLLGRQGFRLVENCFVKGIAYGP